MNSQIEALKEKWKDKKLNDEDIAFLFNSFDQLENHFDIRLEQNRIYYNEKVKQLEKMETLKDVVKLQHEAIGILIER